MEKRLEVPCEDVGCPTTKGKEEENRHSINLDRAEDSDQRVSSKGVKVRGGFFCMVRCEGHLVPYQYLKYTT